VYAVATRDKFVPDPIAQRLTIRNERSEEVWDSPPVSVEVRNPYFERVPAELFAAVVSDVGVLGTDMLADACAARVDAPTVQTLLALLDR
jgi:translation initiation factor 2B subunit (eIF-2B alpha/beta/delta family)